MVIPYVYDDTVEDEVLGNDIYDISAIIGDSVVVEQSDGDTTTKENEFTSSPLLQMASGSKYAFSAQCLDMQNIVLRSIFGAMTVNSVEGAAALQEDHVHLYALVRIQFRGDNVPDMVMPKVEMNSKLFIQQLKSRAGQGNLSGVAFSRNIAIPVLNSQTTLLQFSTLNNGTSLYTPNTPVAFVPKGYNLLVLHHETSGATDKYTKIDFENGTITHNINVNPKTGTIR